MSGHEGLAVRRRVREGLKEVVAVLGMLLMMASNLVLSGALDAAREALDAVAHGASHWSGRAVGAVRWVLDGDGASEPSRVRHFNMPGGVRVRVYSAPEEVRLRASVHERHLRMRLRHEGLAAPEAPTPPEPPAPPAHPCASKRQAPAGRWG